MESTITASVSSKLRLALPRHVLVFHYEDGFRVFGRDAISIAADMKYTLRDGADQPFVQVGEPELDDVLDCIARGNCLFGIIEMRPRPPAYEEGKGGDRI